MSEEQDNEQEMLSGAECCNAALSTQFRVVFLQCFFLRSEFPVQGLGRFRLDTEGGKSQRGEMRKGTDAVWREREREKDKEEGKEGKTTKESRRCEAEEGEGGYIAPVHGNKEKE
jgi:hypothetical protein